MILEYLCPATRLTAKLSFCPESARDIRIFGEAFARLPCSRTRPMVMPVMLTGSCPIVGDEVACVLCTLLCHGLDY